MYMHTSVGCSQLVAYIKLPLNLLIFLQFHISDAIGENAKAQKFL